MSAVTSRVLFAKTATASGHAVAVLAHVLRKRAGVPVKPRNRIGEIPVASTMMKAFGLPALYGSVTHNARGAASPVYEMTLGAPNQPTSESLSPSVKLYSDVNGPVVGLNGGQMVNSLRTDGKGHAVVQSGKYKGGLLQSNVPQARRAIQKQENERRKLLGDESEASLLERGAYADYGADQIKTRLR